MQAPSLFDSTTTGRPMRDGRNTRSQLTYMLFTSTSANMACAQMGMDLMTWVTTPHNCNSVPSLATMST
jgi:hypothetical protein